ncbi:MAG: PAS domain S-box protein [Candidatus Krumholzibacteriia bacterium]
MNPDLRHFLDSLDAVHLAIQGSRDVRQVMGDVLDVVLDMFDCDRAYLLFPCDPAAPTWQVPMERTRPEFPGVLQAGTTIPMDPEVARVFRRLLDADTPVQFGPGTPHPLSGDVAEEFRIKNFMAMALRPRIGGPWQLGIHQCSRSRVWTPAEERLFLEIGHRVGDALASMVSLENLLDSEERYRLVFENSPVPIWIEDFSRIGEMFLDLRNRGVADLGEFLARHPDRVRVFAEAVKILDVNRAALELHGADSKEDLLAGLTRTFTPESFNTFGGELICLWDGLSRMSVDSVVQTLAGDPREVTISYSVCPGHEEKLDRIFVSIVDITERKRTGDALTASEAELRSLIGAMTDIIFVGDAEGRYHKIIDTSPSLLVKPPQELLGRTLHEVFPREMADFFMGHITRSLVEQRPVDFEYSLPIGNRELWFFATISPMSADRFLMVARDITDRKRFEAALADTARRLNEAQRIAHIGNWELDLVTNRLTWSEEIYRIFELDSLDFEATYEAFLQAVHPDDRDAVNGAYIGSLKNRTPYSIEHRLLFPDGRVKHVFEQCETAYEGDDPVRSFGTVQDITDRKMLEEQLYQSQKLDAVGQLAGGVAHDFNNMLGVILGYADMALEESSPADPLRNALTEIKAAGRRSMAITRQLLAFARKQTISPRILDLNRTVEDMLKLLRRLIGEEIDLVWSPTERVWPVKMDPSQLDQILANLCLNARDAIDGIGKVTIETRNLVLDPAYCAKHEGFLPGERVMLAVSDNGCGMDAHTAKRIFEPFFTTKKRGEGTGLGLATVYGIVKQNDGFINVYSEPGRGTTFKIYLPRHTLETSPLPTFEPDAADARGLETILVVEDEPSLGAMVKQMLEMCGYTILVSPSPDHALEVAGRNPAGIDLLITDVVLPGMTGLDLVREIASIRPGLRSLFMSGYTENVIAHHGILEEGVDFLQKPFTRQELAAKVREILDRA